MERCPSPKNPCMCQCHPGDECYECKIGRHKPKYKIDWMLEVEPQLYSSKPNKYIVYSEKLGEYSKRDAKIICDFLKYSGLGNFISNPH